MAHFAKLNEENIVVEVIVVPNEALLDESGVEQEFLGIEYCKSLFQHEETRWVQTSYNGNIRFRYASKGHYYDEERDVFRAKTSPFPSWVYRESFHDWIPPVPMPPTVPGLIWDWDENSTSWKPSYVNINRY